MGGGKPIDPGGIHVEKRALEVVPATDYSGPMLHFLDRPNK
ncbi:uncharacterized protein METZ01_LOCUS443140 [marine metagenome]|uniref:Uncharacterized protein n=1 Tax=marine metagenome TaxID=408172 RepID=A0A382Z456_9ZZZZ